MAEAEAEAAAARILLGIQRHDDGEAAATILVAMQRHDHDQAAGAGGGGNTVAPVRTTRAAAASADPSDDDVSHLCLIFLLSVLDSGAVMSARSDMRTPVMGTKARDIYHGIWKADTVLYWSGRLTIGSPRRLFGCCCCYNGRQFR